MEAASLLLTAGAPIAYVSEQMGHSSIELTVKRYGHLQPGANRKQINNLPGIQAPVQSVSQAATQSDRLEGRSQTGGEPM